MNWPLRSSSLLLRDLRLGLLERDRELDLRRLRLDLDLLLDLDLRRFDLLLDLLSGDDDLDLL